ncbi:type II secretion system protein N [Hydrogenophaga sp.]|uniref:type II secretion system protein N n=1 Tax=Hydrogenophaga sp. TaxID=1904254 RepID=UPI0025BEAD33|nr:type II secretion system protein N [Hydrogenophaga sp.]
MNKSASLAHAVALGSARAGWTPALAAALLWLGAGLSAGYWLLSIWGQPALTLQPAPAPAALSVDVAELARVLGVAATPAPATAGVLAQAVAARYVLFGVVASGGDRGAALIAVDAQPPRPYRVGAVLEGGLVLQAVQPRVVRLGPALNGPSTVELRLPELAAPE